MCQSRSASSNRCRSARCNERTGLYRTLGPKLQAQLTIPGYLRSTVRVQPASLHDRISQHRHQAPVTNSEIVIALIRALIRSLSDQPPQASSTSGLCFAFALSLALCTPFAKRKCSDILGENMSRSLARARTWGLGPSKEGSSKAKRVKRSSPRGTITTSTDPAADPPKRKSANPGKRKVDSMFFKPKGPLPRSKPPLLSRTSRTCPSLLVLTWRRKFQEAHVGLAVLTRSLRHVVRSKK
ncbi:hypothetical protein P154DRAFT_48105 [Amniculicola lignicola CBS 123094]|uniref:Uncharacterized protein n=1 Tax=Amniculicola lignicola CBS 123094 TaxID=1392246 RepID=A0A6A5VVV3_9PLEO|nr:hypothetical protein P154DRAFT_48105 [Amniculicola lignicola CBS 123094]